MASVMCSFCLRAAERDIAGVDQFLGQTDHVD